MIADVVHMNANICWMVLPIDPNFTAAGGMVQMQSIGNSNAWGPSGQPQRIDNTTFTGTAQNAGNASYNTGINVQLPGQSGMTLNLNTDAARGGRTRSACRRPAVARPT